MTKIRMFELWIRIITWLSGIVLLTGTIREVIEVIDSANSWISVSYWIFPVAASITVFFDMWRFYRRECVINNKLS